MPRSDRYEDDDYDDDPPPRRRPRGDSRDKVSHGSSAFGTMLGGSLGCAAAALLLTFAMCGGCIFISSLGKSAREEQERNQLREQESDSLKVKKTR